MRFISREYKKFWNFGSGTKFDFGADCNRNSIRVFRNFFDFKDEKSYLGSSSTYINQSYNTQCYIFICNFLVFKKCPTKHQKNNSGKTLKNQLAELEMSTLALLLLGQIPFGRGF